MVEIEGEFKKQLIQLLASKRDATEDITVHDSMNISLVVVNNALRDFPFMIFFNESINGQNNYSFYLKTKPESVEPEKIDVITQEIAKWLELWFFGKTDKEGFYLINPDEKEFSDP
jgi:hypothetical protein